MSSAAVSQKHSCAISAATLAPWLQKPLDALQQRGISLDPATLPMPRQVVEADLQSADVIVAVDAEAHRPMVQDRFPAWKKRIRFWAVQDLGEEEGRHPIALLEQ